MSVSARTFEVLYIIRQRALDDLDTTYDNISEFIAERRKMSEDIYGRRAYISPSSLIQLLERMEAEGMVSIHPYSKVCKFTPIGSQMADLLEDLDGCSKFFINNYKALVCKAVLLQRDRLGLGDATVADIAATANMSTDTAKRGLDTLIAQDEVYTIQDGRNIRYGLKVQQARPTNSQDDTQDDEVTQTGDKFVRMMKDSTNVDIDVKNVLADIVKNEDDVGWVGRQVEIDLEDEEDEEVPLSKILQEDDTLQVSDDQPRPRITDPFHFEVPHSEEESYSEPPDPYDWDSVPEKTREGMMLRAAAAGVSLTNFLNILNALHEEKVRQVLFEDIDLEHVDTDQP